MSLFSNLAQSASFAWRGLTPYRRSSRLSPSLVFGSPASVVQYFTKKPLVLLLQRNDGSALHRLQVREISRICKRSIEFIGVRESTGRQPVELVSVLRFCIVSKVDFSKPDISICCSTNHMISIRSYIFQSSDPPDTFSLASH
jgi:hypothetical protein